MSLDGQLAKLIRLLGSEDDQQVVAAARMIGKMLKDNGRDWDWLRERLLIPEERPPVPYSVDVMAADLYDNPMLDPWERGFVLDLSGMIQRDEGLSAKQERRLELIWKKYKT